MGVIYASHISRPYLQANPEFRFVFGDNMARCGLGGQARSMRGEPNAIGLVTKWLPSRSPDAYFTDDLFDAQCGGIDHGIDKIEDALKQGRMIIMPAFGVGTGLSELPTRAPRTWSYLNQKLASLGIENPMVASLA